MRESPMSLQHALERSVCAEHSDALGRVIVCQSWEAACDLYLYDHWIHCPSPSELMAELTAIDVDVFGGWFPINPQQ
jgi:hypothetical protein